MLMDIIVGFIHGHFHLNWFEDAHDIVLKRRVFVKRISITIITVRACFIFCWFVLLISKMINEFIWTSQRNQSNKIKRICNNIYLIYKFCKFFFLLSKLTMLWDSSRPHVVFCILDMWGASWVSSFFNIRFLIFDFWPEM